MNSLRCYCAVLAGTFMICGCYHPYPNQGWYGQPGYYPTQPGQLQGPRHLVIPESNGPPREPGSSNGSYDERLGDDFGPDGSFFPSDDEGGVPQPDGRTRTPQNDFNM